MTALPPALASWSRELASLPPDLVAALAPWLGRLSLAIGPLANAHGAPTGELDGVDGLARRGSYERLLMTEWAIGLELPDEFLRRAGSGEHLFVAQARRQPSGSRRSIALVAAGPGQLGAPRLVHLAALIVLARRARAGGAEFAWGVLEQPTEGLLREGADAVTLEHLLAGRGVITATAAHAEAWVPHLRDVDGDRWLIGDGVAAFARTLRAGVLAVRDPLEAGVAAIDVEVHAPGAARARARVRLPLPAPDESARLIRDPFRRAVAPPTARPATGALERIWFVPGARRLAVETGGKLELWPIPSSPRDAPGNPRKVAMANPGDVLVALGARRRVPIVVTWNEKRPHVLSLQDVRLSHWPVEVVLPLSVVDLLRSGRAPARANPGACAYLPLGPQSQRWRTTLVIEGPCGVMLAIDKPAAGTTLQARLLGLEEDVEETEVLGAAVYGDSMVFAALRPGGEVQIREIDRTGVHVVATTRREGFGGTVADPGVRFGFRLPSLQGWGPVMVRIDDSRWDALDGRGASGQRNRPDFHLVGAYQRDGDVHLVNLGEQPRRRLHIDHDVTHSLKAGGEIVVAAIAQSLAAVAWATAGEIVVYSLQYGAVLLRIPREGQP